MPPDYEFHRTSNSPKIRHALEKEIVRQDFVFISVGLRKTHRKEDASYGQIAKKAVEVILADFGNARIIMDKNPVLYRSLNKEIKRIGAKSIRFTEADSKSKDGLQLADYIANLSKHKADKTLDVVRYEKLFSKSLGFYDARDMD